MLKIEHLSFAYGDMQVLWDVSLEVNPGEVVAIVGANGAGKSTILKNISGLVSAHESGHVRNTVPTNSAVGGSSTMRIMFNGADIQRMPTHERVASGIVHVPESRRIFPEMTTLENLMIGGYTPGARKNRDANIERVLTLFPRLRERINQRGGTMSGGEQQMLAIARGLVAEPKLLMLDEPSLGLSPIMVKTIFNVIREISRQGVTILIVEQNVAQSLKVANRAYVLETGRVVMTGQGTELLGNEHVRKAFLGL
jgi:branched-chain amino acid transport system ATP-binding protein